jgi:hypothetical protein
MEYCYQYSSSNMAVKEKRPPPKRGHVKVQIARRLSNLVVPSSAAGDATQSSFRRENELQVIKKRSYL